MSGGNGGAWLIQQARREERRRQRDWQKRRQKSRARNLAKRRARATDDAFAPQRESFRCEFLCADCGYLADEAIPRCPSCRSESILDLADVEVASRLRELEEGASARSTSSPSAWIVAGSVATVVGSTAALVLHPIVGLLGVAAFPLVLARLKTGPYANQLQSSLVPARWRLPAPPHAGRPIGPLLAAGHARGAELLRSPLSGVNCLAWHITVTAGGGADQRRLLDECRSCDADIDGHRITADSYSLGDVGRLWSEDQSEVSHYLRTRGLFSASGPFTVRESVLREGQWVELFGGSAPVVRQPLPVPQT